MPIRVRTPDGGVAVFPDGTDDATITRALQAQFGAPKGQGKKRSLTQDVTGFMAQANAYLPFGDEIAAAGNTAIDIATGRAKVDPLKLAGGLVSVISDPLRGADMVEASGAGEAFRNRLASQRGHEADFQEAHPRAAALARGSGMAAGALIPAGQSANAFAQGSRVANMARGATTAGLTGAAYAAADRGTPQERIRAASQAATDPLTLALGAAGGAIAPAAKKAQPYGAKDLDKLRGQRDAAYRAVDQSGVRYTPEATQQMVADIKDQLSKSRYDPDFHPAAAKMLQKIDAKIEAGYSPTISELDDLRKFVGENVAGSGNRTERRLGRQMTQEIDRFIEGAGPEQVVAGTAEDASGIIRDARRLHGQVRKVETITESYDKAIRNAAKTNSGGNVDNSIRQAMDRVLQKTPNLSETERAALEEIVMGSRGQNALRQVGKLSPQGNGLMLAGHLAAAVPTGGMSAVAAGAGAASKVGAEAITKARVQALIRSISEGGSPAAQQALQELATSDPALAALLRGASVRTSRAAGQAGGQNAFGTRATPAR